MADAAANAGASSNASAAPSAVTPDDLRALLRLAGLSLDQPEIDELLPLYRLLRQRADTLHEADLPLSVPSAIFPADWRG